jgi:hypothetical protein
MRARIRKQDWPIVIMMTLAISASLFTIYYTVSNSHEERQRTVQLLCAPGGLIQAAYGSRPIPVTLQKRCEKALNGVR